MIVEWMDDFGNTVKYDDVFRNVFVLNSSGEVVTPIRPAAPEEVARYDELFPVMTEQQRTARASVHSLLGGTLQALRAATADQDITAQEFEGLSPQVQQSLLAYSAYGKPDQELDRMAFLVLTQVSFAYSVLLATGKQASLNLLSLVFDLRARVTALEAQVTALENNA